MRIQSNFRALVVIVGTLAQVKALALRKGSISRRDAIYKGAAAAGAAATALIPPIPEAALAADDLNSSALQSEQDSTERQILLQKIASKSSDEEVAAAIANLETLDPSRGRAATVDELGGTWELIYSVNAEAFSPLLNLPKPIRPTSLQLLGEDAAQVVGSGRVAQVLDFPIVPLSLVLSSGAVPYDPDLSTLEIFPPFRLEAKIGGANFQLVESGSDADFRSLNARDAEAQAAPRNLFKQRYLETTGKKGDLKISEVIAGDPVIVGVVFVHRRL